MAARKQLLMTEAQRSAGLFALQVNSGASGLVYANPSAQTVSILKELTICNSSTGDALLTLALKGDAEAFALQNSIFRKAFVAAGQTVVIGLSSVLHYGKGLYVQVDADGATPASLNVACSGVELLNASAKQLCMSVLGINYASVYQTPVGKASTLYQVLAVNGSTADATISLQVVPNNGALNNANLILANVKIKPGETFMFSTSTPLPEGYSLMAKADTANAINLVIDGTEK